MMGLLGTKIGMTQVFGEDGSLVAVTAVALGPCSVVQKKTVETDGYNALQLGFKKATPKRMPRALRGHFEKKGLPLFTHVREFRTEKVGDFNVGDELLASGFKPGDIVDVAGVTKGRGFQGVIKRHGKHGGPAAHGSDFHRRPGSIGMRTWPGRVPKNMKLPGHMGNENRTTKGISVVAVRPDENIILLKGSLPGTRGGMLIITAVDESFATRPELRRAAAKQETPAKAETAVEKE
jgi:large subunit ribosomal protein L3